MRGKFDLMHFAMARLSQFVGGGFFDYL